MKFDIKFNKMSNDTVQVMITLPLSAIFIIYTEIMGLTNVNMQRHMMCKMNWFPLIKLKSSQNKSYGNKMLDLNID